MGVKRFFTSIHGGIKNGFVSVKNVDFSGFTVDVYSSEYLNILIMISSLLLSSKKNSLHKNFSDMYIQAFGGILAFLPAMIPMSMHIYERCRMSKTWRDMMHLPTIVSAAVVAMMTCTIGLNFFSSTEKMMLGHYSLMDVAYESATVFLVTLAVKLINREELEESLHKNLAIYVSMAAMAVACILSLITKKDYYSPVALVCALVVGAASAIKPNEPSNSRKMKSKEGRGDLSMFLGLVMLVLAFTGERITYRRISSLAASAERDKNLQGTE